jgi:hypothetical protein
VPVKDFEPALILGGGRENNFGQQNFFFRTKGARHRLGRPIQHPPLLFQSISNTLHFLWFELTTSCSRAWRPYQPGYVVLTLDGRKLYLLTFILLNFDYIFVHLNDFKLKSYELQSCRSRRGLQFIYKVFHHMKYGSYSMSYRRYNANVGEANRSVFVQTAITFAYGLGTRQILYLRTSTEKVTPILPSFAGFGQFFEPKFPSEDCRLALGRFSDVFRVRVYVHNR